MKLLKEVPVQEVWNHWKTVEGHYDDNFRSDIREPLPKNIEWFLGLIEGQDVNKIFIISSDDWKNERLCIPDFRLSSATTNYTLSNHATGKPADIAGKESVFSTTKNLDTCLFFVTDDPMGPFTIIEGNRRAIALNKLELLSNLKVYRYFSSN